ncbi:hypothetical protein ABZ807_00235 [Micromonospora sp. NPDC047548]|uniref:hypothetical protein n=1 Tax=Micromonospora sp. NPDC047548 TaxID=3155624 RepID=UPI0033C0EC4A
MVAGLLALLCVSGGVIGYVLYDRATAPDRSAPDVVAVNYLQAALVARDDNKANLFTCAGPIRAVDEFREQLAAREQELDTVFSVNIENVAVTKTSATSAVVHVVIRRSATIDGVQQSLTDTWRFDVADQQEGWRVCMAAPA